MGEPLEKHLVDAVLRCVFADNGDGLRDGLARLSEDGPNRLERLVFRSRRGVVENELDGDLRVLVARRLFRLRGAALDFLLVDLRGLLDLDAFDEAREDDAVHFDELVFDIYHGAPSLPLCCDGLGVVRRFFAFVGVGEVLDLFE